MHKRLPTIALAGGLLAAGACSTGSDTSESTETSLTPVSADCAPLTQADIAGGTTLPEGSCHTVASSLRLSDGVLNIEPGVQISFETDAGLTVSGQGKITAEGTTDAPIDITSVDQAGSWQGIQFDASVGNVMRHVAITNGGSAAWTGDPKSAAAVYLTGDTEIEIADSTIAGSASQGMIVRDGVDLTFEANTLQENAVAAWVHPDIAGSISGTTVLENNDDDVVRVGFGNTDSVTTEQTWAAGIPFEVQDTVRIEAPLTLEPGTHIAFLADVMMAVIDDGTLTAEGTESAPITFTSAEDLPGYWQGLKIATSAAANVLDHVAFENGGSEEWTGGGDTASMVRLEGNSKAVITNSTFQGSGNYGLWVPEDGDISGFDGNSFTENVQPMYVHPERAGQIEASNTFVGNDEDQVRVGTGNTDRVSTDQTWHNVGVPFHVSDRMFVEAALTIGPGTVVEFAQDASMEVKADGGGSLRAVGEPDAPVTFQGGEDLAGYWKGLSIGTVSADNVLTGVVVRNAGSAAWFGGIDTEAALHVDNGSVALTGVTFGTGDGFALIARNGATVSCAEVDLGGNGYRQITNKGPVDSAACPA